MFGSMINSGKPSSAASSGSQISPAPPSCRQIISLCPLAQILRALAVTLLLRTFSTRRFRGSYKPRFESSDGGRARSVGPEISRSNSRNIRANPIALSR